MVIMLVWLWFKINCFHAVCVLSYLVGRIPTLTSNCVLTVQINKGPSNCFAFWQRVSANTDILLLCAINEIDNILQIPNSLFELLKKTLIIIESYTGSDHCMPRGKTRLMSCVKRVRDHAGNPGLMFVQDGRRSQTLPIWKRSFLKWHLLCFWTDFGWKDPPRAW